MEHCILHIMTESTKTSVKPFKISLSFNNLSHMYLLENSTDSHKKLIFGAFSVVTLFRENTQLFENCRKTKSTYSNQQIHTVRMCSVHVARVKSNIFVYLLCWFYAMQRICSLRLDSDGDQWLWGRRERDVSVLSFVSANVKLRWMRPGKHFKLPTRKGCEGIMERKSACMSKSRERDR